MIACLRDEQGRITAVCEYLCFKDGAMDDNGKDVFIGELEVNPEHRGNGVFKKLVKEVYTKNPEFQRVVWFRGYKYPDRAPSIYTREKILKHIV